MARTYGKSGIKAGTVWLGTLLSNAFDFGLARVGRTLLSDKNWGSATSRMFNHHRQEKLTSVTTPNQQPRTRVSEPHGLCMSLRIPLDRMYEYRRMLPHYQKPGKAVFVTFCKVSREPFPPKARDAVLQHCLYDNGKRFQLHAAVVMPDHVHLLLTPLCDKKGWPYGLPGILKLIKGASARSVNKLVGVFGPVWQEESFDHVLRSHESLEEKLKYIRQNPVRRGLGKKAEDYRWLWVELHPK